MEILPAIDLRDGKVVRLAQGDYARQTTYSDDPAEVARTFESAGANWIHVVDLDAAKVRPGHFSDPGANTRAIEAICRAVKAKIELGGGARDDMAIRRMLDMGAARAVVGSAAVRNWAWFEGLLSDRDLAGKLALGLDARDGLLAVHGWTETTDLRAVDLAGRVRGSGLGAIVYTDIARDGMLSGVNIQATADVQAATDVPVIASGGVGSLEDIRNCKGIGCGGVIVGRAYYEGRIRLSEAFEIACG